MILGPQEIIKKMEGQGKTPEMTRTSREMEEGVKIMRDRMERWMSAKKTPSMKLWKI